MFTTDANKAFLPDDIGRLVEQPDQRESVAIQVAGSVTTGSTVFRVPIVTADPSAAWTDEADEISASDATLDEVNVQPLKLAGLTVISRELADDSSPAAQELVGRGLARDIARKLDSAYFAASTAKGPDGIASLADANEVEVEDGEWSNGDPFQEAVFAAEGVGARLAGFVANPTDALTLAQLKESDTSNRPLLQPDPTQPTRRMIAGVPLHVSPAVEDGVVWGIPADLAYVVIRTGTRIDVDHSAYFASDSIGVRAVMRVGFAFPHEEAVQKITLGNS